MSFEHYRSEKTSVKRTFDTDGEERKFYALVVDFLNHCLTKFFCRHENAMGWRRVAKALAFQRQRRGDETPTAWRFLENGDMRHEKGQKEAESRERNSAYGNEEVQIIAR